MWRGPTCMGPRLCRSRQPTSSWFLTSLSGLRGPRCLLLSSLSWVVRQFRGFLRGLSAWGDRLPAPPPACEQHTAERTYEP
jgi:hypothetical protein